MTRLDPAKLFKKLAKDIPAHLHQHLIVTGSLAAAYHFRTMLQGRAVNTKDADLIIHPSGDITSCRHMANHLLQNGWRRTDQCYAQKSKHPIRTLRAIRLFPPKSSDYFIEFLNLPKASQTQAKQWLPIKLEDGWYGLPSFRFMKLVAHDRLTSSAGIQYASPAMMALANLLSHPVVGTDRIVSGDMNGILRSAKDLGRVIALAHLTGRENTELWLASWAKAIRKCFPKGYKQLARQAGTGLTELLNDKNALAEAWQTTKIGLLSGLGVTSTILQSTGKRLLVDVIEPLARQTYTPRKFNS